MSVVECVEKERQKEISLELRSQARSGWTRCLSVLDDDDDLEGGRGRLSDSRKRHPHQEYTDEAPKNIK